MVKPISIRLVLTIAITRGWSLRQIDISNAFLHGNLEERIVVSQPQGFVDQRFPHHVCLLMKALFGLKQAPLMWFRRLECFLKSIGFIQSINDPSLFTLNTGNEQVFIFIYVDDMVVTGSKDEVFEGAISAMEKEFMLRRLGDLSFFLGIQVKRVQQGLFLNQQLYLSNLLKSCDLENLKPSSTPMITKQDLVSQEKEIDNPKEYRRVVGSLQYLTLTQPEIQFAVNMLSQYMSSPKPLHWVGVD